MIIDLSRCMGCQSCVAACAAAMAGRAEAFAVNIQYLVTEDAGVTRPVFVPVACIHCSDAPCMDACRNKAVVRLKNGLVVTDESRCMADGACIQACPYGARAAEQSNGQHPVSCDLCAGRLSRGALPACVEACPSRARIFGYSNCHEGELGEYLERGGLRLPDGSPAHAGDALVLYLGLPLSRIVQKGQGVLNNGR